MKKRLLALLLAIGMSATLFGCGGGSASESKAPRSFRPRRLCARCHRQRLR